MKFCKLLRFFNHICKQILQNQRRRNSQVYVTSSHRRCSVKKGVLKNFANFKGKHLCWSLFLIKLQAFRSATLIKKRLQHRHFFVKFVKLFKNTYFEERQRATASKLLFREKPHLLIKILGFMILQIRSKRQKQPSEVVL